MTIDPWYKDGLRFECTRCGNCCGGGPGTVRVSEEEIAALAKRLGLNESEFRERYARVIRMGIVSLKEKPDYDCIFHDKKRGCTVYEDRPKQCRAWPFWRANVRSPENWNEEAKECPGMNHGPLHDREWIERTVNDDGTSASAFKSQQRHP